MNAFGVEQIPKTITDICTRKMEVNWNEGKRVCLHVTDRSRGSLATGEHISLLSSESLIGASVCVRIKAFDFNHVFMCFLALLHDKKSGTIKPNPSWII